MEKTGVSLEEAAQVLKLLGDRTRLSIVLMLYERECCVCEMVEVLGMSQPAISQHLRKLRDAKVVTEDRRGRWIYYRLNSGPSFYTLVKQIVESIPVQETLYQEMETAKKLNQC